MRSPGRQAAAGAAVEHDALVSRRELRRTHLRSPHDAERHPVTAVDAAELAPVGRTMDVERVVAVPHVVDGDSVSAVAIDERQDTEPSVREQFAGTRFVEQPSCRRTAELS